MSYPLQWLSNTFTSRSQTIELLQPEVENHVLTPHDFEVAVRFLPGMHRYYTGLYTGAFTGATAAYGYKFARPRWTPGRLTVFSGLSAAVGGAYGMFRQMLAHKNFARTLEDPNGFMQALAHVHRRLGGEGELGFTMERLQKERAEHVHSSERTHQGPEMVEEDSWNRTQPSVSDRVSDGEHTSDASSSSSSTPKDRWEEIRAANARSTAQQSSWDALRQKHERNKLPPTSSSPSAVDERALEQAKFDAMIEEERKKGSG